MTNKQITWSFVAIVIIFIIICLGTRQRVVVAPAPQGNQSAVGGDKTVVNSVTFYDQSTGASVPATFYSDSTVTFTDAKLGTMTLPQALSGSGARYANADETIVFWNKGDSVFITQDGKIVFNGSTGTPVTASPVPADAPKGKLPAGSAAPGELKAIIGTWVWQHTVVRDAPVITPKATGKFSATFDAQGHVGGGTDCNSYGASYKQGTDGIISIGSMISTQMYCEGSQEQVFTGELSKANSYSFDDKGNLLINYDNNAGSMVFVKK